MRVTINGIRYDSEAAMVIGTAGRGTPHLDLNWWEATLYRTPRSGRYFLAGSGGPMTWWATSTHSSGWKEGSGVKPLSEAAALDWARRHLAPQEVEAAFGASVETNPADLEAR